MSRSIFEGLEGRRLFAGVFNEVNGLAVAEVESAAQSSWTKKTSPGGYTGSAAYQWNGSEQFGSGGTATLTYDFKINNAGTYNLKVRSFNPSSDRTEHNDIWMRVDGGQWYKSFNSVNGQWSFNTTQEPSHGVFRDWRPNLSAGQHSVQISARSNQFLIDRVVLYKDGVNGTNPALPESAIVGNPTTPTQDSLKVTSYSLVNADTEQVISGYEAITSARSINLSTLPTRNLALRVNTNSGVNSVRSTVNGGSSRVESSKPFAVFGDTNGNYTAWRPSTGVYTLAATGYSGSNAAGTAGATLSVALTFTNGTPPSNEELKITSYSLVNADTNQVISGHETISGNKTIQLSSLPTRNLAVRVNTANGVQSVRMTLNGGNARVESTKPFALFGDNNGDYLAWTPNAGNYTIASTGYAGTNASGTAGASFSLVLKFT
jgi:hypothetical protein